jgi:hypothetical protein
MKQKFLSFIAACSLQACGGLLSSGIDDYQLLTGFFDEDESGELVVNSQAVIRFIDVEEISGGTETYSVSFRLNDGGSVETILRANTALNTGIEILISRSGSTYVLQVNGQTITPNGLPSANDSQSVNLEIELDNNIPRLALWWNARGTLNSAQFRSDTDLPGLVAGAGIYWGLSIQSAVLTKARKMVL